MVCDLLTGGDLRYHLYQQVRKINCEFKKLLTLINWSIKVDIIYILFQQNDWDTWYILVKVIVETN